MLDCWEILVVANIILDDFLVDILVEIDINPIARGRNLKKLPISRVTLVQGALVV